MNNIEPPITRVERGECCIGEVAIVVAALLASSVVQLRHVCNNNSNSNDHDHNHGLSRLVVILCGRCSE